MCSLTESVVVILAGSLTSIVTRYVTAVSSVSYSVACVYRAGSTGSKVAPLGGACRECSVGTGLAMSVCSCVCAVGSDFSTVWADCVVLVSPLSTMHIGTVSVTSGSRSVSSPVAVAVPGDWSGGANVPSNTVAPRSANVHPGVLAVCRSSDGASSCCALCSWDALPSCGSAWSSGVTEGSPSLSCSSGTM